MNKLISVIIGQDCENTINMCLESIKDSDIILYVDGGSKDNTLDLVKNFAIENNKTNGKVIIKENKFDKSNPNAISDQRNFYLNFLKEYYCEDWCLVLDADEVLDTNGIKKLKDFINHKPLSEIYSIKMRHLMYTLGFEDASQPYHFVPNRLFKITKDLFYPQGEHCILNAQPGEGKIVDPIIWHLGYLGGAWDVQKRYDQQALRNNGHNLEFLENWNKTHMLGRYPISKVNPIELPEVILDNFGLNKDELYFEGRGLETKHGVMVKQWNEFFKPTTVADFGCGRGPYLFYWDMICNCCGFEFSSFATNNKLCNSTIYPNYDLNDYYDFDEEWDLVTAIDLLEHLRYDGIENAINTLIESSRRYILLSIPFKGTHNCDNDPTHIIKEDRNWWVKKFTDKGLKEVKVPEHFIFKEQLLIFEKTQ